MSGRGFLGIPGSRWLALASIAAAFGVASIYARAALDLEWSVESLRELVARAGVWGPLLYVGILAFRFAVLVPSSILLVGAGLCFGALPGTVYAALGLTLSGLLKYAVASVAGRDFLRRQLPSSWRLQLQVGDRRSTAGGLALICAYPFGPKHIFQIAAILAGMSFWKYAVSVASGAKLRAGAFAYLGDALAAGEGVLLVSVLLVAVGVVPLAVPSWRGWLFAAPEEIR